MAEIGGYGLTGCLVIALLVYFFQCRLVSPRIIHDNIVADILHPAGKSPILAVFGGRDIEHIIVSGEESLHMVLEPQKPTGFVISADLFHIPEDTRNIGLCTYIYYKGYFKIYYGFCPPCPDGDWKKLIRDLENIGQELSPSHGDIVARFTIGSCWPPESFAVPWDRAAAAFFLFVAQEPSELYLHRLLFYEKR